MNLSATTLRPAGERAMTIMEMIVSTGIATMFVAGVIILTTITLNQGLFAVSNYNQLSSKSRYTLDYLSRDVRGAAAVTFYRTNAITLTNKLGVTFSYVWDGSNKVTRTLGTESMVVLTNCDFLSFSIYQRNPSTNFNFVSTTNLSLAKLIDVRWRCSRAYLGTKLNTESVQTARVVLRN